MATNLKVSPSRREKSKTNLCPANDWGPSKPTALGTGSNCDSSDNLRSLRGAGMENDYATNHPLYVELRLPNLQCALSMLQKPLIGQRHIGLPSWISHAKNGPRKFFRPRVAQVRPIST